LAAGTTIHKDLLHQARRLATRAPRRPKQADLRRAVSSAYYALFHLLLDEATKHLLRGRGQAQYRKGLARAFAHSEMKAASRAVLGGTLPVFGPVQVSTDLHTVAEAFVVLQEARHQADYDLTVPFTKTHTLKLVEQAEDAFAAWSQVKRQPLAYLYLLLLLTHSRLTGR